MNVDRRKNDGNEDNNKQEDKADSKWGHCETKTTTKDDTIMALKLQWKEIRQQRGQAEDSQKKRISVATDVECGGVVPALSAVDMKLYWEERRRGEIQVQERSRSPIRRGLGPQNHARRCDDEQVRPGAFSVPGLRRMDDDSINDEDGPTLALAMEVSEDRERQLELYVEQIKRQNEMLVRTLQNIDCAHVIPEHIIRHESTSSSSSPSLPLTKRDKLMASGYIFVAVLGFGTILLLTILIVTYNGPGAVTRKNIIAVNNVTVKYNVTEKIKANWLSLSPISTAPQAPSPGPFAEMPTLQPVPRQEPNFPTPSKESSTMPTFKTLKKQAQEPSSMLTSAPAVVYTVADNSTTLSPVLRPNTPLSSLLPQTETATPPTEQQSPMPSALLLPESVLMESPTAVPPAQPTVVIAAVLSTSSPPSSAPSEISTSLFSDCRDEFSNYTICVASVQTQQDVISCDDCLRDTLDDATLQTTCAWFQLNFCSAYQDCQNSCRQCVTQLKAYVTCLAPANCVMNCFHAITVVEPTAKPSEPPSPRSTPRPSPVVTSIPTRVPSSSSTLVFENKDQLVAAVDQYVTDSTGMPPIGSWNVSRVTDMSYLFDVLRNHHLRDFNEDVSEWDVSSVTDMNYMFRSSGWTDGDYLNGIFNPNLASWDVSNVRSMKGMFYGSNQFNGDISSWDVSNVVDMSEMFNGPYFFGPHSFNNDISSWDTGRVTDMTNMFFYSSFNGDLSQWDVSKVTSMSLMFAHSIFNGDISAWDVSSVVDMSYMFGGFWEFYYPQFDQDISSWNVGKVTSMACMFFTNHQFSQDLGSWDVSRVTSMASMFELSTAFNGDISSWDVSNVKAMTMMFQGAESFNRDLSSWDVSSVTDMYGMFSASLFNQNISSWNVSRVQNVGDLVSYTPFNQDLCNWGNLLNSNVPIDDMFRDTSCPVETSPDMAASPPGPFCYPCRKP